MFEELLGSLLGLKGGGVISDVTSILMSPANRALTQWVNRAFPNETLDLSTIVLAQHKSGFNADADFIDYAKSLGFNEDNVKLADLTSWQDPDLGTLLKLLVYYGNNGESLDNTIDDIVKEFTRGSDNLPTKIKENLKAASIPEDVYKMFVASSVYHPTPSDITRWMIYRAYDDETAKRYNLDEGLDKELYERYREAGMIAEYALREWRATWRFPSFYESRYILWYSNYLKELLNSSEDYAKDVTSRAPRDKNGQPLTFEEDDFKYIMRVNNYPKYFQEMLTQIAYEPISRRVLQEMYRDGIIKEDELKARLARLGYAPEDVDRMVQWTKVTYSPDGHKTAKGYTRSLIDQLFYYGKINKSQYHDYMQALGYDENAIQLYTTYNELRVELDDFKKLLKETENYYRAGLISSDDAYRKLINAGLNAEDAQYYVAKWEKYITVNHKKLTLSQIYEFYTVGIISEPKDMYNEILKLNYDERDAKYLCKALLYKSIKVAAPASVIKKQRDKLERWVKNAAV